MNATVERIVERCERLQFYADRLQELRCSLPPDSSQDRSAGESLWGGTLGAAAGTFCAGASRWYHALEPHYEALDGMIRCASPSVQQRVLADARVRAAVASLHRLRAAYEYDKESAQAKSILASDDAPSRLARLMEQESYWALGPDLRRALEGCRDVLVLGSGPLPLSALTIAAGLGARVTCVERDPEAFALGQRVIEASEHRHAIRGIESDILDVQRLDGYDAILGVVLLGVDIECPHEHRKPEIVDHVLSRIRPGASLVLREPHGLGRLLYPCSALNASHSIEVTRWIPEVGPDRPYRSALTVARRLDSNPHHAHPGPLRVHS